MDKKKKKEYQKRPISGPSHQRVPCSNSSPRDPHGILFFGWVAIKALRTLLKTTKRVQAWCLFDHADSVEGAVSTTTCHIIMVYKFEALMMENSKNLDLLAVNKFSAFYRLSFKHIFTIKILHSIRVVLFHIWLSKLYNPEQMEE